MQPIQKKLRHPDPTGPGPGPISLTGSPELIQYRRLNFEKGLPTVMAKTFSPPDFSVQYSSFKFEKTRDNHLLCVDRNVFVEHLLPYVCTLDLFSLLLVCKQMYAQVHPFLLKRAVSRVCVGATAKGLSCLVFYENAVSEIILNRQMMHESTKHMDAAFLAHAKLNKSRIRRALLLKYEDLNAIHSDSRTTDPFWPTLLVLTAIQKHGSIDNIMSLKDYKKEQKQAQLLENQYIQSKRPERMQSVVTEFERNGFELMTKSSIRVDDIILEILNKFAIFYDKDFGSSFSKKLDKFLKMETYHDNPFYLVNSIIPTGRCYSRIFNLLEGSGHLSNATAIYYILDNANLFNQDEQLFGLLVGNGGWERLIKSILNVREILYTSFCCLWDKKELVLSDIVETTNTPEHFFGVRKGYDSFITTMNTFEPHGDFHIAHAWV